MLTSHSIWLGIAVWWKHRRNQRNHTLQEINCARSKSSIREVIALFDIIETKLSSVINMHHMLVKHSCFLCQLGHCFLKRQRTVWHWPPDGWKVEGQPDAKRKDNQIQGGRTTRYKVEGQPDAKRKDNQMQVGRTTRCKVEGQPDAKRKDNQMQRGRTARCKEEGQPDGVLAGIHFRGRAARCKKTVLPVHDKVFTNSYILSFCKNHVQCKLFSSRNHITFDAYTMHVLCFLFQGSHRISGIKFPDFSRIFQDFPALMWSRNDQSPTKQTMVLFLNVATIPALTATLSLPMIRQNSCTAPSQLG